MTPAELAIHLAFQRAGDRLIAHMLAVAGVTSRPIERGDFMTWLVLEDHHIVSTIIQVHV